MRGHAHWWDLIAPYFADRYQVLAIDLSGMGDSARRALYDNDTFTRDIVGVIERESTEPVAIFGHSFGGGRTLAACAARPDLFRQAVIIDSPVWLIGETLPRSLPARPSNRIYPDRQSALARFRLEPEQPVGSEVLRSHVAEHSLHAVSGGWTWKFDPHIVNAKTLIDPATLGRIRTRTDFVVGELSCVVDKERAARIASLVPTARRPCVIPQGHHHLMLDQPLALISALQALLVAHE